MRWGALKIGLPTLPMISLQSLLTLFAAALGLWAAPLAQALEPVSVPSLDRPHNGGPLVLPSFWFAATKAEASAPAMLLLHGCSGPYSQTNGRLKTRLSARLRDYANWLNERGVHVLVIDSLTPRGEVELCTQKIGGRAVTQLQRRRDALGGLQWLARQPGVDAARLGLLGWSHGGSTVLAASHAGHWEVRRAKVKASLAVAFYPGCAAELRGAYRPVAPLLMLLGGADDWAPSAPCVALAEAAGTDRRTVRRTDLNTDRSTDRSTAASADGETDGARNAPLRVQVQVDFVVYPGAHHGFDSNAPLQFRTDIPNGAQPGAGVHVGGQAEALRASREQLDAYLRSHWNLGGLDGAAAGAVKP